MCGRSVTLGLTATCSRTEISRVRRVFGEMLAETWDVRSLMKKWDALWIHRHKGESDMTKYPDMNAFNQFQFFNILFLGYSLMNTKRMVLITSSCMSTPCEAATEMELGSNEIVPSFNWNRNLAPLKSESRGHVESAVRITCRTSNNLQESQYTKKHPYNPSVTLVLW